MTSPHRNGARESAGTPEAWRRLARRTMAWASAAGGLLTLGAALVAWSWFDELPDRVASHWSDSGAPDGFSTPESFVLVFAAVALGLLALFFAIGVVAGATASTRRLAAGGSVWSGGFVAAVLLTTLAPQRGLTDASQVTLAGWVTAATLLVPLVPAVVAGVLAPGDPAMPADGPVPGAAPRITLHDGERAVWLRRTTGGPGLAVGMAVLTLTAGIAVVLQLWVMLVVPVLLAAILVAMFAFTVRVDATGLTVRSTAGWPGTHVPATEVVSASVVGVRPFAQFGGWGWRVGHGGRVGVVLRKGEGILVERSGGRSLVVTVDDAATGAALLNTVAEQAR